MPWKDIQSQMTSLRAIFGQNLKKKNQWKSGQGTDEHFTPKWMFWEQMQFLVPTMEARQSRDTLKVDKDGNQDNFAEPVCTSGSAINRKRQMEKTREELYKECIKVMKGPPEKETGSSFGAYVNEKLAIFDRRRRSVAEKKIMDVLYEVEMGGIDGVNTNIINYAQQTFHSQELPNPWPY